MNRVSKSFFKVQEFARRSGVTIRTLHHYDHLGLLKPSLHSESGYRLYGDGDFARLQQIATLKFIGFSLKQIKEFLDGEPFDLGAMLRLQREMMEEKRHHLELAILAIDRAEAVVSSGEEPDWETFNRIIEVINMENNKEWMKKYYTEEQLDSLAERGTPEVLEKGQSDWAELIAEVEVAVAEGVDPGSERGQGLAARWSGLVSQFTMGDPGITESLKNLYADQANWPTTFRKPYSDEVEAFISKAGE